MKIFLAARACKGYIPARVLVLCRGYVKFLCMICLAVFLLLIGLLLIGQGKMDFIRMPVMGL
jgi:hypothetical protein